MLRGILQSENEASWRSKSGFSSLFNKCGNKYALAVALLLGAIPALFAIISWQNDFEYTALRHYSLPIVFSQVLVILLAMLSGSNITKSILSLDKTILFSTCLFFASATVATIYARSDPSAAIALFTIVVIHGLFFIVLSERLSQAWRAWRRQLILALMIGVVLFTLIVLLLAASVVGQADFAWGAFGAGVTNVRQLGFYGVVLTALAAGSMGASSRTTKTISCFLFMGLFLSAWSGGRAALGSVAVIIITIAMFSAVKNRVRVFLTASVLLLAALPISIILAPHELYGAGHLLGRLFVIHTDLGANDWSSNRFAIWHDTWNGFTAQPWLGHGEGQFRHQIAAAAGEYNHPHNSPLQFLYAWGAIGSIGLAALLVRPVLDMREAARSEPDIALPAIGTLAGLGSMSLLEGSFYHPFPLMCTMIAFALLHSVHKHTTVSAKRDEMPS